MIPRLNGCASRVVLQGKIQHTKASHLLSYLFSALYYFSSVISSISRDQPQDSGLSVLRICSLPVSYIFWTLTVPCIGKYLHKNQSRISIIKVDQGQGQDDLELINIKAINHRRPVNVVYNNAHRIEIFNSN